MIPCLKEENLALFSATADQRYLLGRDSFFRTHTSAILKKYLGENRTETWQEKDLLNYLKAPGSQKQNVAGNRTIVLYGAAGTGKSEIIRWLFSHLGESKLNPYALRISRTELDPVQILHKILSQFGKKGLDFSVIQNWEDLKGKPVSLANHLIWSTLGKLFTSDEEIIPLSYKLRPLLENNLRKVFSFMEDPNERENLIPELLSREDLEELTREYSLPLDLDSEKIRYLIGKELESSVLGGLSFIKTLKRVSQELYQREGIRPLLLVDDLVQSMNVYATDLLDYFITMEEGNWDVVLGLTPASFETSLRGKELLNRINHLDTFGDRILKLWISDEQGHDSCLINLENCQGFAANYLQEFKRKAGYLCGKKCQFADKCMLFQGNPKELILFPFNQFLLRRIFRSLPAGKGKPRTFVVILGEMLKHMARGDWDKALSMHFEKELAAEHADPLLRLVAESYAPETGTAPGRVKFSGVGINWLLGRDICQEPQLIVKTTPLAFRGRPLAKEDPGRGDKDAVIDPGKAAIRDWLNEQPVNKELLKGLRLGISHLLREVVNPCYLNWPGSSRQSSLLKYEKTLESCKIPLSLQNVDSFPGIEVSTRLQHCAYQFHYLHLRRGQAKQEALLEVLNSREVPPLILSSADYRQGLRNRLEKQLGNLKIDELAYIIFMVIIELGQEIEDIPLTIEAMSKGRREYPREGRGLQVGVPGDLVEKATIFFKDCFQLRENIYDGYRLRQYQKKYKRADLLMVCQDIKAQEINEEYRVNELSLSHFVTSIQGVITELEEQVGGSQATRLLEKMQCLLDLLEELQYPGNHSGLVAMLDQLSMNVGALTPGLLDWQSCNKLLSKIKNSIKGYLPRGARHKLHFKNPFAIHRFLFVMGDIEHDQLAFRDLWALIDYRAKVAEMLGQDIDGLHKVLYFDKLSSFIPHLEYLKTGWPRESGSFLESLQHLLEVSQKLLVIREKIELLKFVAPSVDEELCQKARSVKDQLGHLSENIPPWFKERVKGITRLCSSYIRMVSYVKSHELIEGESAFVAAKMNATYKSISEGKLENMLKGLGWEWEGYLYNLHQTILIIGGRPGEGDGPALLNERTQPTSSINVSSARSAGGAPEGIVALQLVERVNQTNDQIVKITGKEDDLKDKGINDNHAWIKEKLIRELEPEIVLNQKTLGQLASFFEEYQSFDNLLRARLKFKEVSR